jgi:hypothetical protein
MKEVKEKETSKLHLDEPICNETQGYIELDFPYFDWTIKMQVADEWNTNGDPDTWLRIFEQKGDDEVDVTFKYMLMPDGPGYIRPTLYNLREVMRILDENIEEEEDEGHDGD